MGQKAKYGNKTYENEQPEGWFDPENYSRNRSRDSNYKDRNSAIQYQDRICLGESYGRANYAIGQDANSGFPAYRHITDSPRKMDEVISTRRSYLYGDNFEGPVRYKDERSYEKERRMNNDQDRNTGNNGRHDGQNRMNGHQDHDRDWWDRTTDEVASWFGDDDAERRRRTDKMFGPHKGKGPKGYSRTDERIVDDINERLYQDSFIDASDIEVSVNNGDVVLSGTVDTKNLKRRVEDLVESVSGVKDVENHLKVKKTDNIPFDKYENGINDDANHSRKRNWS
ncbi:MAG: BON domain-containing protein [Ferruginibacter sp.]